MVIALIVTYIFIILFDITAMNKVNNKPKTVFVYITFIIIGFSISLIQILQKPIQSPSEIIKNIVQSILGVI